MCENNSCKQMCDKNETDEILFHTGAKRLAVSERFDLISPIALRRLALVMASGAQKYEERNWEAGIPLSCLVNHAISHIQKYLEGWRNEDHLAHAMANLMMATHIDDQVKYGILPADLDDLPDHTI